MAVVNTLDEPYLNQLSLMLGIFILLSIFISYKLKILFRELSLELHHFLALCDFALAEHKRKNVKAFSCCFH